MSCRLLSEDLQQVIFDELGETPEKIEKGVNELREWIKNENHHKIKTDEQWLLNTLRGCRYNVERTKSKLEAFSTLKYKCPELFSNRDPFQEDIQEVLKLGLCLPLPKTKGPTGPRLLLGREVSSEVPIVLKTVFKVAFMILEILAMEDDTFIVAGARAIADSADVSLGLAVQITPHLIKTSLNCLRDGYILKIKGIHVINSPWYMDIAFNLCKSLLPTKVQQSMHNYNEENMEELYEEIPLSILPKEYGGDDYTLEDVTAEWKKKVESYRDWFLDDDDDDVNGNDDGDDTDSNNSDDNDDNEKNSDEDPVPETPESSSMFGVGWLLNKLSFE